MTAEGVIGRSAAMTGVDTARMTVVVKRTEQIAAATLVRMLKLL